MVKSATEKPAKGKHGGARPNTGGARPGSGRKKKAVLLAGSIERIKADIEALAPKIGPALDDLVVGIFVEERIGDGVRRVYQRPPDIRAIQEVVNRIAGKVTDKVEHSGSVTTEVHVEPGTPRKPAVE
ncbi:MAG: hypothetical protein NUW01_00035 [Gemmatimonadaceae bacterium]|nr:hypothetical protein [Gemmatimonadaceae bacterium]